MLELMFITNDPKIATIAEKAGVQIIFVDLEYIGKNERQKGLDTVQSHHTINDIKKIRNVLEKSKLLVRCNPIHEATNSYCSSDDEIKQILWERPDIIMLPFFKTTAEVEKFVKLVDKKAKTMLLLETQEAVSKLDEILKIEGIDYIHIGLNDLSLSMKRGFMFDILFDGTVESIIKKIRKSNISYGFGGIASLGKGMVPSDIIISEHYRLGSSRTILSRSFCNIKDYADYDQLETDFLRKLKDIRSYERRISKKVNYEKYAKQNLVNFLEMEI